MTSKEGDTNETPTPTRQAVSWLQDEALLPLMPSAGLLAARTKGKQVHQRCWHWLCLSLALTGQRQGPAQGLLCPCCAMLCRRLKATHRAESFTASTWVTRPQLLPTLGKPEPPQKFRVPALTSQALFQSKAPESQSLRSLGVGRGRTTGIQGETNEYLHRKSARVVWV